MKSKDFFHRKRLLPKRPLSHTDEAEEGLGELAQAPLQERSDERTVTSPQVTREAPRWLPQEPSRQTEDPGAAIFDRPTIVPQVSPEVLAARAMQQQTESETATTARAPRLPSEPSDDDLDQEMRVTLSTDDLPVGEQALFAAHRSAHHAVNPPPQTTIKRDAPQSGPHSGPHSDPARSLRTSDPAESGGSALGFVDSLPRATAQPPAMDKGPRSPHAPSPTATALSLSDMYAVGDFSGALQEAERRLMTNPTDGEALRCAQDCRRVLVKMQLARLGSLQQVVHLAVPPERLQWLTIDHRAGFFLSLVDGRSTLEDLLDICGMPRLEALHLFVELNDQGIIDLRPIGSRR